MSTDFPAEPTTSSRDVMTGTAALRVERVVGAAAIAAVPPVAGTAPLDVARVALTAPDLHLVVRGTEDDAPLARASLWWSAGPELEGEPVGRIGHFAAATDAAAHRLLDEARAELASHGLRRVVGPMDGTTWFSYRFVTDTQGDLETVLPPVLLEPTQPAAWPAQWVVSGFAPLSHYVSTVVEDLTSHDPRLDGVRARMQADGLTIRSLEMADFEAELDRIYAVARDAFRDAFLYTPIDRPTCHALYAGARELIVPELVLLAERDGAPVGFAFSLPDLLERARGEPVRTVIVKTVAVLPGRQTAGLGALLAEETHHRAHRLGFTRAVHALMHERNTSLVISRRQGLAMRRYTLFQASLDGFAPGRDER